MSTQDKEHNWPRSVRPADRRHYAAMIAAVPCPWCDASTGEMCSDRNEAHPFPHFTREAVYREWQATGEIRSPFPRLHTMEAPR